MIEKHILANLIHNEEFTRKVAPFLSERYFKTKSEKIVFETILSFFTQYNKMITPAILEIELNNRKDVTEGEFKAVSAFAKSLVSEPVDSEWLLNSTEEFCKKAAVFDAMVTSLGIIEGRDKTQTEHSIPGILQAALNVSFQTNIGHDYIENADERYDYYHRVEERIPFDIDILNKITKGGLIRKTLNATIAESGAGKSAWMCHLAAATMRQGLDVLYITMEMAEEKISERVDANLMKVNINDIEHFDKDHFMSKIEKIKSKSIGKLIVKEYPTSSVHAGHFRALLEELKAKKKFKPKLIIIDYLNICCSSRVKLGSSINTYTYVKFIAEELRGLAVEYDVPIWTATQTNRAGYNNSDINATDTSESMGLVHTLDLYLAQMAPEELQEINQMMFKQLKNRYNDPSFYKRFVVGFDRPKMTFYDLEESAQDNISKDATSKPKGGDEDKPLFDKSGFGHRMRESHDFGDFSFGDGK